MIGSTTRETSEVSRLRDYAIATISQHLGTTYDDTPEVVVNLAAAQLVGYLFDKPSVSGGVVLANAFKFSGAGQALFPYRIHHVGLVGGDLVRAAQASVGTDGNPVVDVTIIGGDLVVEFARRNHGNPRTASGWQQWRIERNRWTVAVRPGRDAYDAYRVVADAHNASQRRYLRTTGNGRHYRPNANTRLSASIPGLEPTPCQPCNLGGHQP